MSRITVNIDNTEQAELLFKMLQQLNFVNDVEFEEHTEEELTKGELQMLEDRWENYLKNPKSAKSWEEVKTSVIKKYDL